jgi:hypothetical protein
MKWSKQTKWISHISKFRTAYITKEDFGEYYEWRIEEDSFFPSPKIRIVASGKTKTLSSAKNEARKADK